MFSVPTLLHMLELLPARESQLAEYAAGKLSTIPLRSMLLTYWSHVSVIGFLFGFSLASSFAAYRLLDEYKLASATLQASVEELQQSTEKACGYLYFYQYILTVRQVSAHVRRIEAVEKDLKALTNSSASKDDLSRLRAEVKKIYDGLHIGEYVS